MRDPQNPCLLALIFFSLMLPAMTLRTTIEAAQAVGLMPRAEVCGGIQGLNQCGNDFPSDFCCEAGTNCFGFNNNQGVICCPQEDCSITNPLSCDPNVWNATANARSNMHLVNSNVKYQPCGSNTCCPPGYSCSQDGTQCELTNLLASISSAASTAKSTSIPTPTAVTGISANSIPTTAPSIPSPATSAGSTNTGAASSSSNQFPIQAVLVGLFPGLVGGCLLAFLFVLCLGRRKKPQRGVEDDTSSFGPVAAKVSDPIYVDSATRTDFLRYNRPSRSPQASSASSPISRVRSLFSKTPSLSPRRFGDQPASPASPADISTPQRQIKREPSMESIKIYSPPDARFGRNTTFGDLLPNAGGRQPPPIPFMGSPSMVDPRKRGVDSGNLR